MPSDERLPLTRENILALWTETYNTQGTPDWSHLFPYYHDDLIFQDSIQRIEGKEPFMAMCRRLADRCASLDMEIRTISFSDGFCLFEWVMTMRFKRFPNTPLHGCTRLTFHQDGRIIEQRDYYDLWGDIFDHIPWFKGPYRRFLHRKFG